MRVYNENKMFTYLRGFCKGAGLLSSLKALGFMREKHGAQTRADSQLYIVHPLWMACYAAAMGITDDDTIAVILLHDVCEDTGVSPESLPFSENIRRGVKYVTFRKYDSEDKHTAKIRYFKELLESREALICKGLDRFMNLSTMEGVLSEEAIIKNIKETDDLLLPAMKAAKEKWPDMSDFLFVLRANIRAVNNTLAAVHGVEISGGEILPSC